MALKFSHIFFPGIVFHELSHYLACVLTGVEVKEVKLFDSEEAYIRHSVPRHAWQSVLIAIAPFLIGTVLGFELLVFAFEALYKMPLLAVLFFWLGFSIVLFSFPSKIDAMNAFGSVKDSLLRHISTGSILNRALWAIVSPFLFIPIVLICGFLLLFDEFAVLRVAWAIVLFLAGINAPGFGEAFSFIDYALRAFFEWIFKGIF